MAVNYKPIPDAQPQLAPTPSIREDVPQVRFSGAVGEALQYVGRAGYGALGQATEDVGRAFDSLGKNVEGAGREIFQRAIALKELESNKKVDDLVIAYNQKQTDLGEKFRNQYGEKAGPDALTAHINESKNLRAGMRAGLTPYQLNRFDDETRGIFSANARQSLGHSAAQFKHSLMATNEAKISMEQDAMGKSQTDEELQQHHNKIERLTREGGDLAGKTPEILEHDLNMNLSKGFASYISALSDRDPTKAMQLLMAKKDEIMNPFFDKLKDEIQGKLDDRTVRLAAQAAGQDQEADLADKVKKAEKEARKTTDDPRVIDKAIRRTEGEHSEYEREKFNRQRKANDMMDAFTHGRLNPEGKLPTKREEIDIDPRTKQAFDLLTNKEKDAVETQLTRNSLEQYAETPDEVQRFHDIRERSYDPANYEEFRNLRINGDLRLSVRHRNALLDRKDEIEKQGIKAMDNPHVKRAEGILLSQGLIPEVIRTDRDSMNRLRGVLHDEIDLQQKLQRREMTDGEIRSLGLRILATDPNSGMDTGWFGKWFTKPAFETMSEATKKRVEDYKKEVSGATDDEAMRAIANSEYQLMFEKYFGKKKTAPSKAGPAAPQSQ